MENKRSRNKEQKKYLETMVEGNNQSIEGLKSHSFIGRAGRERQGEKEREREREREREN